jgi:hypothetical protein
MYFLVTGGRSYGKRQRVREAIRIYAKAGNVLIHGGAKGADTIAHEIWTEEYQLPSITVPAPWKRAGRAAGMMRNDGMVKGKWAKGAPVPTLVIAFPGGRGTNGCVSLARQENIPVFDLR